jgi:PAS domain S-box-containing protein
MFPPVWDAAHAGETVNGLTSGTAVLGSISREHCREFIYEKSPVGIAVVELDGRYLMANPAFQRMLGYTEAELLELTPLDIVVEADRPAMRERVSQLGKGALRQYQVQKRYQCKDGGVIWVRSTISLIPALAGLPQCVLAIAEDITECRHTEEELRKQREILQKVFDHIPVMIRFTGADGRTELVNREWERTTGWNLEEIQRGGMDVFSECYPDPRDRRQVLDFIHAAPGGWVDFKPRVRDGRTLDTTWAQVRLSDGSTIGIGVDITERRRTEEALRESEQRLLQLAERVCEVLWIADRKAHRVLYVSPAYEEIWGRSCDSIYRDARSFQDAIHPEDRQRYLDVFEEHLRNPKPVEQKYRVIRPDGSIRWIRDCSFPVRDAAGEVYRYVGIAEDITKRTQAEEKRWRSEAYLAEAERLGHIGAWAIKLPTTEITFWSPEHYRIFGFDPAKGLPAWEAVQARVHPEDRAILGTIIRAVSEQKGFEADYRIVIPDGPVRHIHALGRPMPNAAGEPVEYLGVSMDVTERKAAEEALQSSVDQLRSLAARIESVREEERTRLAREIHDELGQALVGIEANVSSLSQLASSRSREHARRCRDIMDLARNAVQSVGRIATELRPGILDDCGLVDAVEWEAQQFAKRTRLKCVLDLPPTDLDVERDAATALFRIFQEALSNIARHAEATEFGVRLAEADGGLSMEVRDNGRGFLEAQVSQRTSLGLLGMRERAALLAGRLTVRSSPGAGATVTVWIPTRGMKEPESD